MKKFQQVWRGVYILQKIKNDYNFQRDQLRHVYNFSALSSRHPAFSNQSPPANSGQWHASKSKRRAFRFVVDRVTQQTLLNAIMASVTSLDKDMRKLRLGRYTPQAANEVRSFIEDSLGARLAAGDLLDALKDGVALCQYEHVFPLHPENLLTMFYPGSLTSHYQIPSDSK